MSRMPARLLLSFALLACSDVPATAPQGKVSGVYVLRTIKGAPLPARGDGEGLTEFTVIADTIRVFEDGFGEEVMVTTRPGQSGQAKQDQLLQFWDKGSGTFDVEYSCPDLTATSTASCIAPPHHRGVQTNVGMTFTYSVFYRVPLTFERVGDYKRPSLDRSR